MGKKLCKIPLFSQNQIFNVPEKKLHNQLSSNCLSKVLDIIVVSPDEAASAHSEGEAPCTPAEPHVKNNPPPTNPY